jgi:hypothetical protein
MQEPSSRTTEGGMCVDRSHEPTTQIDAVKGAWLDDGKGYLIHVFTSFSLVHGRPRLTHDFDCGYLMDDRRRD